MAWTRDQTQEWIVQVKNRLEDIDYYLKKTVEWCEDNNVYDDQIVFACASMTVIWVSYMRGELISKREVLELLSVKDWNESEDIEYSLRTEYSGLDHEELLEEVVSRFY